MDILETNPDVLMEAPQPATEMHKRALAKMYANDEFRSYLVHAIQVANKNALTSVKMNQPVVAKEYSIRAEAIEALMNLGRHWYIHFDKLDKLSTSKKS